MMFAQDKLKAALADKAAQGSGAVPVPTESLESVRRDDVFGDHQNWVQALRAADRAMLRAMVESGSGKEPDTFVVNPAKKAWENTLFRCVLYTGPKVQLVVMSLLPNEDIGAETHRKVEQVIAVASGEAEATLNGEVYRLEAGGLDHRAARRRAHSPRDQGRR
jgi:hypothetical protein